MVKSGHCPRFYRRLWISACLSTRSPLKIKLTTSCASLSKFTGCSGSGFKASRLLTVINCAGRVLSGRALGLMTWRNTSIWFTSIPESSRARTTPARRPLSP